MSINMINEYGGGCPVEITTGNNGCLVIRATNQGGDDFTEVDLRDVLVHVKEEMPDLWNEIVRS